jgi:hypothetical protein
MRAAGALHPDDFSSSVRSRMIAAEQHQFSFYQSARNCRREIPE